MSWGISATSLPKEGVEEGLKKAADYSLESSAFDSWDDDVQAQQDLAFAKVKEITESGAVGDGPFNVSCSGHCQRDENDPPTLYVSVSGSAAKKP